MPETIKTQINEKTGWITLSREERRNALNPKMLKELSQSLNEYDENRDVLSIVLTGSGEKAFCAGMDLAGDEAAQLSPLERHEVQRQFLTLFRIIKNLTKPLVARVNGVALGGGFGLMCACDIVIAAEDIQCGTPEINLGLFPYVIMATLIRTTTNPKKLLEIMFTGNRISAIEGKSLGFINEVVRREELDKKVQEILNLLNKKSPAILRLGRRAFYTMRDMEYEKALEYLSGMLALNMQAEDMLEGIMAFMQKREPEWKGK